MNQSSGPADKALSTQFIEASKPTGHRCRPDERRALIHREEKRGSGDLTRRGSDDAALNPSNPRSERGTTHCKNDNCQLRTIRRVRSWARALAPHLGDRKCLTNEIWSARRIMQ